MGYIKLKLANTQSISEPFQCFGYKMNWLWPFDEKSPKWQFALQMLGVTLTMISLSVMLLAEWTFVFKTAEDVLSITDGVSTALEGTHVFLRIPLMAARQAKMRSIYRRFYREIYFTNDDPKKSLADIEPYMRISNLFSTVYYLALASLIGSFVFEALHFDLHDDDKPYIFRMTFELYDQQKPFAYIVTSLYTTWLLSCGICLMAADDCSICLMLCHTSFRFKRIQEDLENLYKDTLDAVPVGKAKTQEVHNMFRRKLNAILKRQQKLIDFIGEADEYFTYTIFISLTFATLCICVVMFQCQKTVVGPLWVKFFLWFCSKTAHVVLIGYFGQMLTDSASELQNSFYNCGWEKVAEFGNRSRNKELVGDIRLGIIYAQKELVIVGLKLIPITHEYVGVALRSAWLYFMFIRTMDELADAKYNKVLKLGNTDKGNLIK